MGAEGPCQGHLLGPHKEDDKHLSFNCFEELSSPVRSWIPEDVLTIQDLLIMEVKVKPAVVTVFFLPCECWKAKSCQIFSL